MRPQYRITLIESLIAITINQWRRGRLLPLRPRLPETGSTEPPSSWASTSDSRPALNDQSKYPTSRRSLRPRITTAGRPFPRSRPQSGLPSFTPRHASCARPFAAVPILPEAPRFSARSLLLSRMYSGRRLMATRGLGLWKNTLYLCKITRFGSLSAEKPTCRFDCKPIL